MKNLYESPAAPQNNDSGEDDEALERYFDLWAMSSKDHQAMQRHAWRLLAIALIVGFAIAGIIWLR
jgi:hypothetical protein